jgi:lipoate-protein ligase A
METLAALGRGVIFREMELWFDPQARSGPESMAVDEWLLETRQLPMMRVYKWDGSWGSLGYFGKLDEAEQTFPGLRWVRRWTGGGVVDHREDWTYSLMIPKKFELARLKGGESYRAIHQVLVSVLACEGDLVPARAEGNQKTGSVCFENPVEFDVVGSVGEKLAGAAQRRCQLGLLHQGSVSVRGDFLLRGKLFAEQLAETWSEVGVFPDERKINQLVSSRYGTDGWLKRRC